MSLLKNINDVVFGVAIRNPYVASDVGGDDECFYCQNTKDQGHTEKCTYKLKCGAVN